MLVSSTRAIVQLVMSTLLPTYRSQGVLVMTVMSGPKSNWGSSFGGKAYTEACVPVAITIIQYNGAKKRSASVMRSNQTGICLM
jgi:hypothetical protein